VGNASDDQEEIGPRHGVSRAGSGAADAAAVEVARAKLNEQLSRLLSFDIPDSTATFAPRQTSAGASDSEQPDREARQEGEFEFRLFSNDAAAAKVVLTTADKAGDPEGELQLVRPRPLSHYVAGELTTAEKEIFAAASVSGEDIIKRSAQRAWGLEIPWRVTKITASRKALLALTKNAPEPIPGRIGSSAHNADPNTIDATVAVTKRKRPGKKRRIALRTQDKIRRQKEAASEKARNEKAEADEKQKLTKDEHLKEKKKRLNRERKLKRRQKERDKKQSAKTAAGANAADDASSSDD